MSEHILEVAVPDATLALDWLESAPGLNEAYLSGAMLHAVVGERSAVCAPDAATAERGVAEAASLQERLRDAGFSEALVTRVEPTIEDVFVHLVSAQRERG